MEPSHCHHTLHNNAKAFGCRVSRYDRNIHTDFDRVPAAAEIHTVDGAYIVEITSPPLFGSLQEKDEFE